MDETNGKNSTEEVIETTDTGGDTTTENLDLAGDGTTTGDLSTAGDGSTAGSGGDDEEDANESD